LSNSVHKLRRRVDLHKVWLSEVSVINKYIH
jgi:hypothetical protein